MSPNLQSYPRISDESSEYIGLLDESELIPIYNKLPTNKIKLIIRESLKYASVKAKNKILNFNEESTGKEREKEIKGAVNDFLKYLKRIDPGKAEYYINRDTNDILDELVVRRTRHNEMMHTGWRNQKMIVLLAQNNDRFIGVSDQSTGAADLNFKIPKKNNPDEEVSFYMSVKNREDTISGGSFKGDVASLELLAVKDKNRSGPYCCVFALGIECKKNRRNQPNLRKKTKHSINTEIWMSDFLWPFISGYTYREMMSFVSETATITCAPEIPEDFKTYFKNRCCKLGFSNKDGLFCNKDTFINWLCT